MHGKQYEKAKRYDTERWTPQVISAQYEEWKNSSRRNEKAKPGKDPDAGEDCRQEEKGMTEDEMVG